MAELIRGVNDLETLYPKLAKEWHPTKNGDLKPCDVTVGKRGKFWWLLPYDDQEMGKHFDFEWEATILSRVRGSGCPYLVKYTGRVWVGFNDLKTLYPGLAREWHPTKNLLGPEKYTSKSKKEVWWKCEKCGFVWQSSIITRSKGGGLCPRCKINGVKDLKTLHPELALEWVHSESGNLHPDEVTCGLDRLILWRCRFCGHTWWARISSRARGTGCPKCANYTQSSFPEQTVYYYILKEFPDAINRYRDLGEEIDVYIPSIKVGIEYDGGLHQDLSKDVRKNIWCKKKEIFLYRIRVGDCPIMSDGGSKNIIVDESLDSLGRAIEEVLDDLGRNVSSINVKEKELEIKSLYLSTLKENSLQSKYPEIAKEWHPTKNVGLTPDKISCGNPLKVWWKCSKCNYEWKARIADRTSGRGCPQCARKRLGKRVSETLRKRKLVVGENDLATVRPDLVKEWDFEKNGLYTPDKATCYTNDKVYWICSNCGESYSEYISNRCNGLGKCPKCGN